MPAPEVSVIVPGWNVAAYLAATLKSIAEQHFANFEVIMVDDGSTDDTHLIMESWAQSDTRFRAIKLAANAGVVAARNAALSAARGTFVAMLDGDDLWTPEALAIRLNAASAFPAAVVIATEFSSFDREPGVSPTGRVSQGPRARQALSPAYETGKPMLLPDPFDLVATVHFAWTGATLIRRQAMSQAGNFDPKFAGPEDTLLWLKLANRGAFVFVPQITAHYRQRHGSIVNLLREPKEFHYLKVLEHALKDPQFRLHRNVLYRLKSECHAASAWHFRRKKEWRTALTHALRGIRVQPLHAENWRNAVSALIKR